MSNKETLTNLVLKMVEGLSKEHIDKVIGTANKYATCKNYPTDKDSWTDKQVDSFLNCIERTLEIGVAHEQQDLFTKVSAIMGEVNDINTARGSGAGSGSATAGLIFGGQAPPGKLAQTEAFDGTSFTEVADLSKGIYEQGYSPLGASPQSNLSAISAGGKDANPGTLAITEEWEVPLANKTITST